MAFFIRALYEMPLAPAQQRVYLPFQKRLDEENSNLSHLRVDHVTDGQLPVPDFSAGESQFNFRRYLRPLQVVQDFKPDVSCKACAGIVIARLGGNNTTLEDKLCFVAQIGRASCRERVSQ